jgi:copper transport protein
VGKIWRGEPFAAPDRNPSDTLTRRTRLLAAAAVTITAAATAADASAHARLLSSSPADGAVLATPPLRVVVRFDDTVRALAGTTVVRNGDRSSVTAGKATSSGRVVTIPLQRIGEGAYTVKWRILSDDGHTVEGVFAFGVGAGRAPPSAALSASSGPTTRDVLSRWLFFAGLLVAVGVLIFLPLAWRPALRVASAPAAEDALWAVAFIGFFLAFLGASGLTHHESGVTRFSVMYDIGGVAAIVGATLAAIALVDRRFGLGAFAAAAVLLPVPSLAGHALDRGQLRPLNAAADILHVAAAAVWIGGLLALAVGLPRTARLLESEQRSKFSSALVQRLSAIALVSVAVIAATGLVRALSELSAVSQLWNTGYGRALLIKSGLLAVVVALAWINQTRLLSRMRALRRGVAAELLLLAGVITAVAFLTDLAPGRQLARAVARPAARRPIEPPPAGATVLAAQSGGLAVGVARLRTGSVEATVLGPDNRGVDGLPLTFRSGSATLRSVPCGPGCYRAAGRVGARLTVRPDGSAPVTFVLPRRVQPAAQLVHAARTAYRSAKSLVIHERLASSPQNRVVSTWQIVAPSRLTYVTSGGARAVVIGPRRWDKFGKGRWQESAQTPLSLPGAQWSPRVRDAKAIGWRTVDGRRLRVATFFDPRLPAWFELAVDPQTKRPLRLEMIAAAHFMHHRYTDFDVPIRIVPPVR